MRERRCSIAENVVHPGRKLNGCSTIVGGFWVADQIVEFAGPEAVEWREVTEPARDSHVLVDVVVAGVSFADLLQTKSDYQLKPPLPYSPGMDAAGVVRWAPPGAGVVEGQRAGGVCGTDAGRRSSPPADRVLPLPDDVGFDGAGAALGLNYMTALFALTSRAPTRTPARRWWCTARQAVSAPPRSRSGARWAKNDRGDEQRREAQVRGRVRRARGGADRRLARSGRRWTAGERAVDIVFDPVGGDGVTDSIRTLAPDGRLLVLGFAGGEIPTVRVNRLLLGNRGVLGAASLEYFEQRPGTMVDLWADLLGFWRAGTLPIPLVQRFSFADARGALPRSPIAKPKERWC